MYCNSDLWLIRDLAILSLVHSTERGLRALMHCESSTLRSYEQISSVVRYTISVTLRHEEVRDATMPLKSNKSSGLDGAPAELFKTETILKHCLRTWLEESIAND